MRLPRNSIAKLMLFIAIVAADLAAFVATLPAIPNPGLAVMVVVLEAGLFVGVARRGSKRAFWIGFEAFGWSYVLACFLFNQMAWWFARRVFEESVLGAKIATPDEMLRYILFGGCLHLVLSLSVALAGGLLCRRMMRGIMSGSPVQADIPPDPRAEDSEPEQMLWRIGLRPAPEIG